MQPYVVQSVSYDGRVIEETKPKEVSQVISADCAEYIAGMMQDVVENGTGSGARVNGVNVAGKTGTAENSGEDHAWFVGFAPAEDPQIAVAVVLENDGGSGGGSAAPVASRVMNEFLMNYSGR